MKLVDDKFIKQNINLIKRTKYGNKYDYGHVLVIAGSYGMAGAAVMCIKACLKTGAGLVTAAAPESIIPIIQVSVPEAMCIARDKGVIDFHKYDTIIIGPGLGVNDDNKELLVKILDEYDGKLLIDADALNIIASYSLIDDVANSSADIVITPHEGEAKRLANAAGFNCNEKFDALIKEYKSANPVENTIDLLREDIAKLIADEYKVTIVLKGTGTLVVAVNDYCGDACPVGHYMVSKNSTGNPGMATAGSGDVLSGITGAMLAQGLEPYSAAVCGVYFHGLAGDAAASQVGEISMNAKDIISNIKID